MLIQSIIGQAQNDFNIVRDLQDDWRIFENGKFDHYSESAGSKEKTIYFELDPGYFQNREILVVESINPFNLYLNYKLISFDTEQIRLSIDSLKSAHPTPWLFSIHSDRGLAWLNSRIMSPDLKSSIFDNNLRIVNGYQDLAVIASVVLFAFFVILFRTNPRLTMDYFNFVRLFSIQEREEVLLNTRISASVNIPYYLFSVLVTGFVFLSIFHFGSNYIAIAEDFKITSLSSGIYNWIKLSMYIGVIVVLRYLIIALFSILFNLREAINIQFFNFARLIFFIIMIAAVPSLFFFVFKIQRPDYYYSIIKIVDFVLIIWVIIVGLKLLSRTSFRFFHLFSYLCASEIIPIVMLVKVLNS